MCCERFGVRGIDLGESSRSIASRAKAFSFCVCLLLKKTTKKLHFCCVRKRKEKMTACTNRLRLATMLVGASLWLYLPNFVSAVSSKRYPPMTDCSSLSPPANLKYWETMTYCPACATMWDCGFCRSTMECVPGNKFEAFQREGYATCEDYIFVQGDCPRQPDCKFALGCDTCSNMDGCAWCSSSAACIPVEEAIGSTCDSLVLSPPCPIITVPG